MEEKAAKIKEWVSNKLRDVSLQLFITLISSVSKKCWREAYYSVYKLKLKMFHKQNL